MGIPGQLGHVDSLFPHIQKDWWKNAYNETYLYADADCMEDPAITTEECNGLLNVASIQQLFQNATEASPVQVLDMGCGQGRHCIHLAKRFPSVHFHGVDQSSYLLQIARERAKSEGVQSNTAFDEAELRRLSTADSHFDVILLLGNGFGHGTDQDNLHIVQEARRVLKPGGIFLIDYVDGEYMRSNFSPSGWEWLDPGLVTGVDQHLNLKSQDMKLIACRERELSPDQKLLASREIVIDLGVPAVYQDLFYCFRLYDIGEMDELFHRAGLCLQHQYLKQMKGPQTEVGASDAGLMECRQLIVGQKPRAMATTPAPTLPPLVPQDVDLYIHPHLYQSYDPEKGRMLCVSECVPTGTVLVVDPPYAIVPTGHPSTQDAIMCSNILCRRQVPQTIATRCSKACIEDVVWCNEHCRSTDRIHAFECAWLKDHGQTIREREDEYTLTLLWIVLRMYAAHHLEIQAQPGSYQHFPWQDTYPYGWKSMNDYRDNQDLWPQEQRDTWRKLVETYFDNKPGLPGTEEALEMISKEEANSFGLYPGATGIIPGTEKPHQRGHSYALGCYSRTVMANHSCFPNVTWAGDERGRIVFTASRDIAANDECHIAYFDLSVHSDFQARQERTKDLFTFACKCERCRKEGSIASQEMASSNSPN